MLDPVREKCDLHIRAAGILIMQLELLEIQRLVALSHNEGPYCNRRTDLSNRPNQPPLKVGAFLNRMAFPFAVVPKAKLFTRTDSARTAEDYAKEFAQKIPCRIHTQFPG